MNLLDLETRRTSFDEAADLYDRVRPEHPPELIDAVLADLGVPARGRVLEIGCGTGQLTVPLARRGHSVLAIEPGGSLAARARARGAGLPIEVREEHFEDTPLDLGPFDLVVAAQSFHWLEPTPALIRTASLLGMGKGVALLWYLDRSEDTPLYQATNPVYERFFPRRHKLDSRPLPERVERVAAAIEDVPVLTPLPRRTHTWTRTLEKADYLDLLRTQSDKITLPEEQREEFLAAIGACIDEHGGKVERRYESVALLATKKSAV